MADPAHTPSTHDPADTPYDEQFYDDPFYSGRQTALLFGAMGAGFLFLLVILLVVGG